MHDGQLQFLEVHIQPLEADQLAAAQPGDRIKHSHRTVPVRELTKQRNQLAHLKDVRRLHPLPALPNHRDRVCALGQKLVTDSVIEQDAHDGTDLRFTSPGQL
jgi:hypothetical protein